MNKCVTAFFALGMLLSLSIIAVNPIRASSKTITVPDNYPTITAAVGNATNGDTIFVKKGTYQEPAITINKSISLIGEDKESTFIQNTDTSDPMQILIGKRTTAIQINADNVKVSNFTITHAQISTNGNGNGIQVTGNSVDGYIEIHGSYNTIEQNRLNSPSFIEFNGSYNNITANIGGGMQGSGSFNVIFGNILSWGFSISITNAFNNVIAQNNQGWLSMHNANANTVGNNNFQDLQMENIYDNTFVGNTLSGPGLWAIYLTGNASNNIFHDNYIANFTGQFDGYGIELGTTNSGVANNIFYHNAFINNNKNAGHNWALYAGANSWDNGNVGNYFSDYSGTDADNDGIGDTPYVVSVNNIDNYPLMATFNISDIIIPLPQWTTPSFSPTPPPAPTASPSQPPSPSPTPTPTAEPTPTTQPTPTQTPPPTQQPTNTPNQPLLLEELYVIGAVAVTLIIVAVAVLIAIKLRLKRLQKK
jgi:nitrous oxidase accessory protein